MTYEKYHPLIQKKWWPDAFSLLVVLSELPSWTKINKTLCGRVLKSPARWRKAMEMLKFYWILDDEWVINDWDLSKEVVEEEWHKPIAWIICRELPWSFNQVNSLLKYSIKAISKVAEDKRYTVEEYLPIFIKEVRKDNFWSKYLTADNFVRKFELLDRNFWANVPKKPWMDLNSLSHIF